MLGVGTWFVDQQALALDVLSKEVEVRLHCLRLCQHSAFLMNRLSRRRSIQWLLLHRRGDWQCSGGVFTSWLVEQIVLVDALAGLIRLNYKRVYITYIHKYADDTLIFGTHTQSINKFLQAIQVESAKYNMLLNFDKCVNITINQHQSSVKFLNGTSVPRKDQAKYLGATLTDTVDNRQELSQRIGAVVATARQLNPLWFQARTSKTWKIRVFESTLASKLLYGLESIQLTLNEQKLIDNFQMKMLRKILGVPSTYVNRAWTNQAVLHELSQRHGYKHIRL